MRSTHLCQTIVLCPWLVLEKTATIKPFEFVPFDLDQDSLRPNLENGHGHLKAILAGYRDEHGQTIRRATLVVSEENSPVWDFGDKPLTDVDEVTSLFFLCASACNRYYTQLGQKVNSSYFGAIAQSFVGSPGLMTYRVRRRDGYIISSGYRLGEIVFSRPVACHTTQPIRVDDALVGSFEKASQTSSAVLRRVVSALSFFQLANTDSDEMRPEAEVILMAAAFEQLLGTRASAWDLGDKLSHLLGKYGTKTISDMAASRTYARLSQKPKIANQSHFIHRKWIEELYRLRGAVVHGRNLSRQTWLWEPSAHLVFGAFLFPLVVKLLLASEGHCALTGEDIGHLKAVDMLLCLDNWAASNGWEDTLSHSITYESLLNSR